MPKVSKAKKTKKIKSASLGKKPLLVLVAALFIAIGVAAVIQTHAASSRITVCNANKSYAPIKVYDKDTPSTDKATLWWNQCVYNWWNGNNDIRVDVNPEGYGYDVDSYQLGEVGHGYNGCHDKSENDASDPPDYSAVNYRNYAGEHC